MVATFPAPFSTAAQAAQGLRDRGYAVLSAEDVAELTHMEVNALRNLEHGWQTLAVDHYLRDGGNYRKRRHACFVVDGNSVEQVAHRPHWQSTDYNALHGGMQRWFEPIASELMETVAWTSLLRALGQCFAKIRSIRPWYVEAHQFRIDTSDGIGRPTPEGAHRDGVDFVAVFLVGRHQISGGETRVFDAAGPNGQRFTLTEPWSVLLLDDTRVIHESTPIQPGEDYSYGHRDTLVLTYRGDAFQADQAES